MKGEILSLETAEKIAKLEKENKQLKQVKIDMLHFLEEVVSDYEATGEVHINISKALNILLEEKNES